MRRRDFLKALGIGAFACAVHNVPKVLVKPSVAEFELDNPGTLRLGMDGKVIYDGPHNVVPAGRRIDMQGVTLTISDGAGRSIDVEIEKGDLVWTEVREPYVDSIPEMWARDSLRILEEQSRAAALVCRDFGEAAGVASDSVKAFGRAAKQCADVIS